MLNLPFPSRPPWRAIRTSRVYAELSLAHPSASCSIRAKSAPLQDRRVRQALNMAVDRQAIIKNLFNGRGQILNTVTGRNVTQHLRPRPYPYDPAEGQAAPRRGGIRSGLEIQLWQSIGRWTLAEETVQVIAGYWDKVGITTKLQVLEWAEYNKRSAASQFKDALLLRLHQRHVGRVVHRAALQARLRVSSRYFDASGDLLKAIRDYEQTFDAKKRKELAAQALKGLHDEAVWVFLWQLEQLTGVSKKVKGFKIRADDFVWVRDTYVEA